MNKKKLHRCLLRDIERKAQDMLANGYERLEELEDTQIALEEYLEQPGRKLPHHRYIVSANKNQIRTR